MIQSRPSDDDVLFPGFDATEIYGDVEWLNEFDRDESWESLRVVGRLLRHEEQPHERRCRKSPSRLSEESRRLLRKISADSPLVRVLIDESVTRSADQTDAKQITDTPAGTSSLRRLPARQPNHKKRAKLERALQRVNSRKQKPSGENPRPPVVKSVLLLPTATMEADTAGSLKDAPDNNSVCQPANVGRFGRVVPRTDIHGEKRRRRLKRLREQVREQAAVPDNLSVQNSGRSPAFFVADGDLQFAMDPGHADEPAGVGQGAVFALPDSGEDPSDMAGSWSVADLRAAQTELEEESYGDWFRRVIIRNRWMTWFTTFYLHWLALLTMAAVFVTIPQDSPDRLLSAVLMSDETVELPPVEQTPLEIEAPHFEEPLVNDLLPVEDVLSTILNETSPELSLPLHEEGSLSNIDVAETVAATVRNPPPPPQALASAGSFSVWTEPSQPEAGEPYRIVIQIRLADDLTCYPVSDLEGMVIGSDGYCKPIPGSIAGDLPIEDGYVRLLVPIVSADERVHDTILIRSKALKESQRLVLRF